MTKSEEKAFEQFVYYIKENYRPLQENMFRAEFDEEFMALVFRVNPRSRALYELEPFSGVFL